MQTTLNYKRKPFIYNTTPILAGQDAFWFFKDLYIQHAKTFQPTWKILIYKTFNILPKFSQWMKCCLDLNIIATQPEYYSVLQHFHDNPQLIEHVKTKTDESIIDILKTRPQLTETIFTAIRDGKMGQYEKALLILLTKTNISKPEDLYTLMGLEATPKQAEEYLSLPQEYITALLSK